MAAEREQAVEVGEILVGKYRVEREIGRGGMGVVVEATHLKLDERVAIKLLHPKLTDQPDIVKRFMREARAASKIKSPHVVRVIDVDAMPSGEPYMVLELLEGFTLSQLSRTAGPLDPATTAAYVVQACDAIAEAHELGIIHRDLKPSNLFLCRDRSGAACVKVLDFGISKVGAALGGDEITNTDQLLGSPTYMSPEQLRSSRTVDARTDIWSLGVVLYQCLTRKSPFYADTMPQVLMRVLSDDPKPPRELRPELPEGLEQTVLRCMDKDPALRFADAQELAEALAPFALAGPVPWPDVTLEDSLPSASVRSALQAVKLDGEGAGSTGEPSHGVPVTEPELGAPSDRSASSSVAVGQDTQVGWGTTLGSLSASSRKKWLIALAAAVTLVAVVGFFASGGLQGADDGDSSLSGTAQAAAESEPPPTDESTGAERAPAPVNAATAAAEPSVDAGAEPTDTTVTTASPGEASPPATRPPAGRAAPARRPGGKVDPFGRSRQ